VLKKQCTRNKANRTITREENEGLMEAMAARMKAQPWKFKLRKELAEHPFGTTRLGVASGEAGSSGGLGTRTICSKDWRKYGRSGGSPRKLSGLTTLAYNLKRVLNLVSFEKLMAAVGVKVPQSV
jgi:hypothetical protein